MKGCGITVGLITVLTNKRHKAVNSGQIMLEGSHKTQSLMESTGRRDWQCCNTKPKEADTDALKERLKRREIRCLGALRCDASNLFLVSILFYSASSITYQIKHYFNFSNCKFTLSFLISAIWRGSHCRRSSDPTQTEFCLSCRVRLCCLSYVGATLSVRPRPLQRMPTLWQCHPTSHC